MPRNKPSPEERRKQFEALAFPHMDALYSTALRMTRNQLDAEDLVQDAFLRAYRFFDKFQEGTNFKAWIFKILTNTFINQYRKKVRKPQQTDFEKVDFFYSEAEQERADRYEMHYDEKSYTDLFGDEINAALNKLSYDFRAVVILCDIEEFSYKEIAAILGTPIGTVMSRLSRARHLLQEYLRVYARQKGIVKNPNSEQP
ncbi:MAG: sigma-70 family RNA polymerase sigma factor [candidate division KSB1 bacterium]|nr:sigma-70 family RNA polymerase sigma factor [candidate division KSB1 bacterium]MDZ7301737.1 sigma-70 family RNA polymerase sigma factor [candidate division KSB1 bacterium]MDZ7311484.1 sigma-70 family RNA polymerase sigma factor [candidate division KSB1 bacterium]